MSKHIVNPRFGLLAIMVLAAALSRLLPHPQNFAPIGAMALFGAAYFANRWLALLLPLAALWISDLALNNILYAAYNPSFVWLYGGFYWVYGAFVLDTIIGWVFLKKITTANVIGSALLSALLFFLITNFGVWIGSKMYPQNIEGLMACYAAGIPYFQNAIAGNLVYAAILFGGFELAVRNIPQLQTKN